ncbi:MAG: hypothetical protein KGS45_10565 [Planctomycetes bacterium]|nr:hypothetical protein [Planctomycetota bacterium]
MHRARLAQTRSLSMLACIAGLAISSQGLGVSINADDAQAPEQQASMHANANALLQAYPGLRSEWYQGRPRVFYGMPMTTGATAEEAAQKFLDQHLSAFGVPNLELEIQSIDDVDFGRFKAFVYAQRVNGVPVEFAALRLLVLKSRPDSDQPAVVMATGKLAPQAHFAPDTVSAQQAIEFVKGIREYRTLMEWSQPEEVVYFGEGDYQEWITPTRCWKFVGEMPQMGFDADTRRKVTFFVDMGGTGLKFARNDVLHVDVNGNIKGWITPGSTADHSGNAPTLQNLPNFRAGITGGNNAYSNAAGNYVISHNGSSSVSVTANLASTLGVRWAFINNTNGTGNALTASATVTPPGPANLILNAGPTEFATAQVNAVHHANLAHDFIKDRAPTFTALDTRMRTNVNAASTCNAFYDGSSINFYRAGGGCNNTAFSSVVAHEYGHHIVNRRSLAQDAFGEGFGDCVSMMIYNDPVIGRYFRTNGGAVRTPDTANILYPCTGTQAIHNCGQTLSGVWWEIKKAYDIKYGTTAGFTNVRQMFVNWYLITAGGGGSLVSAYPTTAIEVLTVNDTDGNLSNGTPDYNEICASFAQHAITCPAVTLLTFSYPDGLPTLIAPGDSSTIRVNVAAQGGTPQPNTGTMTYRVNGGTWSTVAMTQGASNQYTANIPAQPCGGAVEYYFSASTTAGGTSTDPSNAPATFRSVTAANGLSPLLSDSFETSSGWLISWPGDTATEGGWVRGDPVGSFSGSSAVQPENDNTPGSGTNCMFTGQGVPGGVANDSDVDGGTTSLVSPIFDLSASPTALLSYWRWYTNSQGSDPNNASLNVYVSNDGGTNWTLFERVGPALTTAPAWIYSAGRLDTILPITNRMRFKFVAEDPSPDSLIEAAIDDFKVESLVCTPPCAADFNGDTGIDFFDYLDFVGAFSSGNPAADFNGDTGIDFFDYLDFVAAFSTGCP